MNQFCGVAPSPEVRQAIERRRQALEKRLGTMSPAEIARSLAIALPRPQLTGYRDGAFYADTARMPPSKGIRRALVLLVDFPDVRGRQSKSHFDQMLFGGGTAAKPTLRDFYRAASYGKLDVQGEVLGWYTLPKPLTFYVGADSATGDYPNNGQKLVEDALDAAISAGVQFGRFDSDRDGHLDGLIVVHAGAGAEEQTDEKLRKELIWSHKWTIPHPRTVGGVGIWAYTLQPEDGRVGVFCHEFGHFLGLPDLYDISYRSEGVGMWCVMGAGSWGGQGDKPTDFCAWSRTQLGWVKPRSVSLGAGSSARLTPAHRTRSVIRISAKRGASQEYFLLESRQCADLDAGLPGEGLLVWHVDEAQDGNGSPPHYQVGLIQADGAMDLEFNRNRGDQGDPFPGRLRTVALDDRTTPSTRTYGNTPSGVSLTKIAFDPHAGVATLRISAVAPSPALAAKTRKAGASAPAAGRRKARAKRAGRSARHE